MIRAGLALLANGSWAVVPATGAVIRVRVMEREERYLERCLERASGERYLRHEAGVRRWV